MNKKILQEAGCRRMRNKMIITEVIGILATVLVTWLVSPSNSCAQLGDELLQWSTIGSAGILDEGSPITKANFYGGVVGFKGYSTGILELRYPIPKPANIQNLSPFNLCGMIARIVDDGPYANVQIFVEAYNILTGHTETIMEMNSDWVQPSRDFQTIGICMHGFLVCTGLDFDENLNYLRVMIKRTRYTAKAEFGGVIFNAQDCMEGVNWITNMPYSQCWCQ